MTTIPAYALYGEDRLLPDLMHCERIHDRAGPHGWSIKAHCHPQLHQLFLIRRGETVIDVDGRQTRLEPPVVVNMPRWTVHGFQFSTGTDGYVLTFPVAEAPDLFDPRGDFAERLDKWGILPASEAISALFEGLHYEYGTEQTGRSLMLKGLATQLLVQVARKLPAPGRAGVPARYAQIMVDFEKQVQRHYRARWRVADFAAELAVTPAHLSRVVRDLTGASASAFIEAAVFREACRQLAYTRQDIRQIGFDLGYDDPTYFSRMFRKQVGMSPSEYRKRVNDGYSV